MSTSNLPDYHPDTELRIEPPLGRSKSFRIRYKSPDTDNLWVALKLPEIDLANKRLKDNPRLKDHTYAKLRLILAEQYAHRDRKKKKASFMSENLELVETMFKEKYNRRKIKTMKRPEDSKRELLLAAEACGMFPIDTCNLDKLADHLDANLGHDVNLLSRRITWLNSILQYYGRNKLQPVARERLRVAYLNEDEFTEMLTHIKDRNFKKKTPLSEATVKADTIKTLARIAFYTGARLGEIFYIQSRHVKKNNVLFLELQMLDTLLKDGTYKEDTLKNGQSREIFYPPVVENDLRAWAKVPFDERYKIREKSFCKRITSACSKTFGDSDPIQLLNFHDLRHCHAIWLLQKGASIVEVSQQLGNSPEVCYKYYSGWELKKESVERLKSLV